MSDFFASLWTSLRNAWTPFYTKNKKAVIIGTTVPLGLFAFGKILKFAISSPTTKIENNTSLEGKVAIVTGSSAGIGKAIAKMLYSLGATIVMANRDAAKSEAAIKEIQSQVKASKGTLRHLSLDLTKLSSVKQFVQDFRATQLPLHFLINNAGIGSYEQRFTIKLDNNEGTEVEKKFLNNYLGHFLLTELLLVDLEKTKGTVIAVSSNAQKFVSLKEFEGLKLRDVVVEKDFKALKTQPVTGTAGMKLYGLSKSFNTMHMQDMAARYTASKGIRFYSMCPGFTKTEISRNASTFSLYGLLNTIGDSIKRSAENGAQTVLYLVLNSDACACDSGSFWYSNKKMAAGSIAQDAARRSELRELSLELVKQYLN